MQSANSLLSFMLSQAQFGGDLDSGDNNCSTSSYSHGGRHGVCVGVPGTPVEVGLLKASEIESAIVVPLAGLQTIVVQSVDAVPGLV